MNYIHRQHYVFTIKTYLFLYSFTGSEISVMASPAGPNANNTGL